MEAIATDARTTIRLDGREMGRALMARLLGGNPPAITRPVELVERASLRTPRNVVRGGPCHPLRQLDNVP